VKKEKKKLSKEGEKEEELRTRALESVFKNKTNDQRNLLINREGSFSGSPLNSSSSSSSGRCGLSLGVGPEDAGLIDVDKINKLYNWGEFQKILENIKE
jgi:hypothetical protein